MKKKLPIFIYFIFLILYLEFLYKGYVLNNVLSLNTFRVGLFSLPFILFFTILSTSFGRRAGRIVSSIISVFITLIFVSQIIYYAFYDSIFSIYSVKAGTAQVFGGFFGEIVKMLFDNIWIILFMVAPTILFLIFAGKVFDFEKKKIRFIVYPVMFIVSLVITILYVHFGDNGMYSLNRLYNETHAPMITVNKVGLLSTEVLDLKRYLFGFEEKLYNISEEEVNLLEEVNYNILDIDFDTLISSETDETVKSMHQYFNSVIPTEQNEYTGMFEGKNLIYITAEGFDAIGVDAEVTPTLYKLVNNGFVFQNYYQPLFTISTSDGEYMFMNSLIPKEGVWSFYTSSNIYMPFGLGNIFNKEGYSVVNAYHNHTYNYYHREDSHPNLGFNVYKGCGNGLEKLMNCKSWPNSDISMIDATINDYINEESFMVYYMTISGHLNYTFTGNNIAYKNKSLVNDLPYSLNIKAYLATQIELDRALEKLIGYLESAQKLDDTVIVLSPDHYPYGLNASQMNEISEIDRTDKFELFHTNLIIYNSAMEESVVVDKYVSSVDVLPTVYNLFGIDYDSRLLMGRDALSEGDGLVMLSDRSWINENGSYNSITGVFTPFKDGISDDYVSEVNHEVYQKFTMSSLLLYEKGGSYLDYYRRLGI